MLQYLLKFSISLAVLYIFYRAVLRPLTFYQCNRFYLLCYSLLSFVIPFINITPWVVKEGVHNNQLVNIIPAIGNYTAAIESNKAIAQSSVLQNITWNQWLLLLFCLGMIVMIIRIGYQYLSLQRIRSKSILISSSADVQLYQTSAPVSPFSFGNAIYFNRSLHNEEELQRIIQHEFVHVKQRHSVDILIGELLCIVNWFNPFAWLIRHAIRQNVEFIADNDVVKNGINKKEYQYLLLKVVGIPQYGIANNFNFSSLKKRIAMMNKMKSAKLHITKFLFVLPLLAVMLLAFRNSNEMNGVVTKKTNTDSTPVKSFSVGQMTKDMNEVGAFLHNNPSVQLFYTTEDKQKQIVFLKDGSIERYGYEGMKPVTDMKAKYGVLPAVFVYSDNHHPDYDAQWQHISAEAASMFQPAGTNAKRVIFPGDSRVLVQLKNNKVDVYDMDYQKERLEFEAVYGRLPAVVPKAGRNDNDTVPPLPPPPPPVPPPPAVGAVPMQVPEPPVKFSGINQENVENITTSERTDKKTGVHTNTTVVTLKNGKKEVYNLNNVNDRANYIKKYGSLPKTINPVPPPAPAVDKTAMVAPADHQSDNDTIPHPLIVVDGVIKPDIIGVNRMNPGEIQSVNVLKDKAAIDKYGDKGKNGVVEITTVNPGTVTDSAEPRNFDLYKLMAAEKTGTNPMSEALVIIDGIQMPPGYNPNEMKTTTISLMQVLHGTEATMRYGDKANKGAIQLLSKNFVAIALLVVDETAAPAGSKWEDFMHLKSSYEVKNVLRGKDATDKYGDKGKHGVIEIKTRKRADAGEKPLSSVSPFSSAVLIRRTEIGLQPLHQNDYNRPGNKATKEEIEEGIMTADTIIMKKQHVLIKGGNVSVKGKEFLAEGELSFWDIDQLPFVIYNGKEITDIHSFKVASARYSVLSLDEKQGLARYGTKAKYGAIEINRL